MHDIKYIRDNFDDFKKKISKRNNTTNIDNILDLDKKNRMLIQEKESLENKKRTFPNQKMKKCFKCLKKLHQKLKNYLMNKLIPNLN